MVILTLFELCVVELAGSETLMLLIVLVPAMVARH
jgi:hypothetical protein